MYKILGSKEFPVEGEYFRFLQKNGGRANAYTSGNHTNYFLKSEQKNLKRVRHTEILWLLLKQKGRLEADFFTELRTREQLASEVLPLKSEELLNSRKVSQSPTVAHNFYVETALKGYTDMATYRAEEDIINGIELDDVVSYGQEKILKRGKTGSFVKVTKKKD